jgi:hypothetical protein
MNRTELLAQLQTLLDSDVPVGADLDAIEKLLLRELPQSWTALPTDVQAVMIGAAADMEMHIASPDEPHQHSDFGVIG